MSLAHAILGFLSHQPRTGYELKTECFDQSVGHFWPADQAQIYRTLDKLSEQGFVTSQLEIQGERPNRKVYHLTDAGRGELLEWLNAPQDLPAYREPFLVQLYFAGDLPNETILGLIEGQLEAHQNLLHAYQEIEIPKQETMPTHRLKRWVALAQLTLDMGIRREQMEIDWLHHAAEMVKNLPES